MKLFCLNCHRVRSVDVETQKRIAERLKGQLPSSAEIIECVCGLTQWIFALRNYIGDWPSPQCSRSGEAN